jgi:hypothetical protein
LVDRSILDLIVGYSPACEHSLTNAVTVGEHDKRLDADIDSGRSKTTAGRRVGTNIEMDGR